MAAGFEVGRNSGRRWAGFTIDQLSGQAGLGFYRLSFLMQGHIDPSDQDPGGSLITLVADVRASGKPLGRAVPTPHSLPITAMSYSTQPQVVLELDLDRDRLEALETVRNGGDLQIDIAFFTALNEPDTGVRALMHSVPYAVNQGVWVSVLEQMRYRTTLLLEVPVPDAQRSPALAAAVNALAQAQQAMAHGNYREAVGLCRDVLEEVKRALNDTEAIDFSDQRSLSKADRLRLLRRAARVFMHPARHSDDVAVTIEWSRIDAAFAISLVTGVLNELAAPGAT